MKKAATYLTVVLSLSVRNASAAIWTETFDIGVGRFQYTEADGQNVFRWNSSTQALDATFIRRQPVDRRYAQIGPMSDANARILRFSTSIMITGQTPGGESDPADSHFGFFNSTNSSLTGYLFVGAYITRPNENIRRFYLDTHDGEGTSQIPFDYGTTYFVDATLDGPQHSFVVRVYRGQDAEGEYLGTMSKALAPNRVFGFDALGFSGWGDSQHTVVTATFDNFTYTPEPATLMLLILGLATIRRRQVI